MPKEFVKDFAILYHSYDTNIHNILKKAEDVTYEITSEMITQIKEGVFYYVWFKGLPTGDISYLFDKVPDYLRRGFKSGLLNLKTENKYIRKYEVFKNI